MNENCHLTRKNTDAASKHVKIKSLYLYKVAELSFFKVSATLNDADDILFYLHRLLAFKIGTQGKCQG